MGIKRKRHMLNLKNKFNNFILMEVVKIQIETS